MNTTQGRLYLTAIKSLERLEIQFLPKELEFNRTANWGEIAIVGRNNPLYHFTGGSNELRIELDFLAEEEMREDVIRKCKWLEALTSNDGYEKAPEQVRLTFGNLFKNNEVWIVREFNYKVSSFSSKHGYLPQQAYGTLVLSLDPPANRKHSDIKWT